MEKDNVTPIGQITFNWDKAHNTGQIQSIEDDLFTAFRGITLTTGLSFRRNPKTHADEIILTVFLEKDERMEKLCEFECNPGQYRTSSHIVETVRSALKQRKMTAG